MTDPASLAFLANAIFYLLGGANPQCDDGMIWTHLSFQHSPLLDSTVIFAPYPVGCQRTPEQMKKLYRTAESSPVVGQSQFVDFSEVRVYDGYAFTEFDQFCKGIMHNVSDQFGVPVVFAPSAGYSVVDLPDGSTWLEIVSRGSHHLDEFGLCAYNVGSAPAIPLRPLGEIFEVF